MVNQEVESAQQKKEYQFDKLPENIRQMGEQPEKNRVYIEDYVVTYMHQIFQKKQEEAIVVFVGQKGEGKAKNCSFIYGAIEIDLDLLAGNQAFTQETWNEIYDKVHEYFPASQVLGWGCGVSMWNSQIDKNVRQIQQKHFSQEEKLLFLEDLSEKEEKIWHWHHGKLQEMSGYVIYYDKNPQMQDYMLGDKPKKSFEAEYQDSVTSTVREVIHRKEETEETKKFAGYTIAAAMILLAVFGANLLLQSTKKIDSLEKTLETLSNAAVSTTAVPDEEGRVNTTTVPSASIFDPVTEETPIATVPPISTEKSTHNNTPKDNTNEKSANTAENKENSKTDAKKTAQDKEKKQNSTSISKDSKVKATSKPKQKAQTNQSTQETSTLGIGNQSYLVRSGDTLSQIVLRQYHSMDYMEIVKQANNITNEDDIKAGQLLVLPAVTK